MSNKINPTYPMINDINGTPLDAGFIFIGATNVDPESNQLQLFWDQGKTKPAIQPIRTKNGYIVNENQHAKLYVESSKYSIKILNRNKSIVFQDLNHENLADSSSVNLIVDDSKAELVGYIDTQREDIDVELSKKAPLTTTNDLQQKKADITYVDDKVAGVANGLVASFTTYALADAAKNTLPANSSIKVTNDPDPSKNGEYTWDGVTLRKSDYDPKTQAIQEAKEYTDEKTVELDKVSSLNLPFSVSDSLDNVALAVLDDGTVAADELKVNTIRIHNSKVIESEAAFSVTDKNNNAAFAVLKNGVTRAASLDADELRIKGKDVSQILNNHKGEGNFLANLIHFEIYGQSLSQGAYSTPLQTLTQKYDSLMFVGGIRPQHKSYDVPNFFGDFIPLIEAQDITGYVGYETPCGGATDCVKQLINDENRISFTQQIYKLLGSACGEGGMSLASLSTTYFENNLKPAISNAFNLSQAKGLTYAMPLMGWVQGEEDNKPSSGTTIESYKTGLQSLITKVDTHLKTLDENLKLNGVITTQLCSFKTSGRTEPFIELAIYQASIAENSNVYLACPLYIFDYADGYHIKGIDSKWMGAYIGLVHKRVLVDGQDWKPVHPVSHVKQGRILEVKFHVPVQPLVFDVEHVALNSNYGFSLVDENNNAISISSVSLTQSDTVKIIANTVIPQNAKLRYAWTPSSAPNRTTGPRGNLRDSQGDDLIFDPKGINKPLHNWCPIFEYAIN